MSSGTEAIYRIKMVCKILHQNMTLNYAGASWLKVKSQAKTIKADPELADMEGRAIYFPFLNGGKKKKKMKLSGYRFATKICHLKVH